MPNGTVKNSLYRFLLPIVGKKSPWQPSDDIGGIYHHYHTVGACFQPLQKGQLGIARCYGLADLAQQTPVTANTWFRVASLTKTAMAFLVMRMQTLKLLDVHEDISALWHQKIRNPYFPQTPITLGMLLSHTSSICDSPSYYASYQENVPLSALLANPDSYLRCQPGSCFSYSNLAAGMVASLLEYRFQQSIEQLIQEYLLQPLAIQATFELSQLKDEPISDLWRVLPARCCYRAQVRQHAAAPIHAPNPEQHYLLAAGQLMITAPMMGKLCTLLFSPNGFLDENSLHCLQTPLLSWPNQRIPLHHAMGLFSMKLPSGELLYGHQGLAYGAVNGLFFNQTGDGFVSLTAGASEQRIGHLCALHHALIQSFFAKEAQP